MDELDKGMSQVPGETVRQGKISSLYLEQHAIVYFWNLLLHTSKLRLTASN